MNSTSAFGTKRGGNTNNKEDCNSEAVTHHGGYVHTCEQRIHQELMDRNMFFLTIDFIIIC